MKSKCFLTVGAVLCILLALVGSLSAQSTAFTYQGRLFEEGTAATGSYDITFRVFDAASDGAQLGGTVEQSGLIVSNGLFTATVDFGVEVFTGPDRWIDLSVRTNSASSFVNLSPRQQLTPAPYAIFATKAATAGSASAVTSGAAVESLNGLKDQVLLQAGANVTITPNGNTLTIASSGGAGDGIWSLSGTNAYFNTGKVGIGTSTPRHSLSIAGGPYWTQNLWRGAIELESAAAIAWQRNGGGQRFGLGQSSGGLYFFRTASDPGTTTNAAVYDMSITDSGNVVMGNGTERTGIKLQVNGAAAIAAGGSGGEVQFGAPNGETGMTIIGSSRADIRFNGSVLKLVAGAGASPPSTAGGVSIATSGKVGVGTATPAGALHVASGGLAVTGGSSPYTGAGSGVFLESGGNFGSLFAFNYSTFTPRDLFLNSPGGNVAIGNVTPAARLHVEAPGFGYGTAAIRAVNTPGLAGEFVGRVKVTESLVVDLSVSVGGSVSISGNLSKGSGSFKIDHPLDPANKYLYHSFVESPDMMNIYNGTVAVDDNGEAVVQLPEWFEALNKEFHYQLTAIGAPGPDLYIAEEVTDNKFKIAGGKPGSKVSWQLTGVRQDAYANAHRIQVEEDKVGTERGTYLHPEVFGQPSTKNVLNRQR